MTPYEIPLTPEPQSFSITLAGFVRKVRLYWCPFQLCWVIDLNDGDGTPIIQAIPLITGADLLAQYKHLNLGGYIVVQSDFDVDAVPTAGNLGSQGHVYFLVD